ncbi:MAG: signal peptide peptidase SppA [Phycisphaerales bacterium]|jgi:protease IV|nr:signal peptide peptidase SppA [Phycisphaerales bacterium]
MNKTPIIVLVGVVCLCAVGGCGNTGWLLTPVPLNERLVENEIKCDSGWFVRDKIAVVDVSGVIFNDRSKGLLGSGENPVSLFIEKMDKAQADPNVCALLLRINSPGGGVTASDIMYNRIQEYKTATGKPVVAVLVDVAASGGYYIACAADEIIAHKTTITGSIGVIVQAVSFAGTMDKIGVTAQAITSGKMKDMGSPLKPLDPADIKVLQGVVDDFYAKFVAVVDAGRPKLTTAQVKTLADGRIFTADEALANGLVDSLGYMDQALAVAKTRSGSDRVRAVMYGRPVGHRANAYSMAPEVGAQFNLINVDTTTLMSMARPNFMYLWSGR